MNQKEVDEHHIPTNINCIDCGKPYQVSVHGLKIILDGGNSPVCPQCADERQKRAMENIGNKEKAIKELNDSYHNIIQVLKYYLDMPEDYYKFVSTWIVGTYFHECFNTYPFLFINAMRGSGKTRLLRIIASLVKGNCSVQNNISEAVLFRTASEGPIILDEFEGVGTKEKVALREILQSAYKKGTTVKRMRKGKKDGEEKQIVEEFHLYTPVAMANIWGMDDVLGDRCVSLILEKSDNRDITNRVEDFEDNPVFLQIKRTLREFSVVSVMSLRQQNIKTTWNVFIDNRSNDTTTLTTLNTLTTLTTPPPVLHKEFIPFFEKIYELGIDGRNLELLLPVFIVASRINEKNFDEILRIGKEIIEIKKGDELTENVDISLIDFVSKLPSQYQISFVNLSELNRKFREHMGEDEDWINPKWMGRALKRLKLVINTRRVSRGKEVTLDVGKAIEKIKMFKTGEKDEKT